MDMKEEQKLQDEKEAIDAMRNAQKHMADALHRISTLENELKRAADNLERCKGMMPRDAYQFNTAKRLHDLVDEWIATARKSL